MSENYIRVENITEEVDDEAKGVVTSAHYSIFIPGMGHRSVIGVLSTLLRHMEIDPLEIIAYRLSHDDSRDHSHGIAVWPEALRRAAELGAKGNDNPSVSAEPLTAPFAQGSLWRTRNEGHKKSPPVREHRRAA